MVVYTGVAMSKGHMKHARPIVRPGDGAPLPMRVSQAVSVNGRTITSMGVDMSTAPVPDRKYVADIYGIVQAASTTKLLFGQQRIGRQELRSLLVVHMSTKSIQQFLENLPDGSGGNARFEDVASEFQLTAELPAKIVDEPSQVVAFKASAIVAAMSGPDACLDFYQVSPSALIAARNADVIAVDPVVRVDVPSAILLGLAKELLRICPKADLT